MKNTTFKSLYLFVKPSSEAESLVSRVKAWATKHNIALHRHSDDTPLPQLPAPLALVLGGDGTMLSAISALYGTSVPLAGINFGHLGFLTEGDKDGDIQTTLNTLFEGNASSEQRPYYLCEIQTPDGEAIESWPFANDITLLRHPDRKMIAFNLNIQQHTVANTRADGLIIATPTGSTAYNLSAGGPIIHPGSSSLVVTPICPHTFGFRPVVVPPEDIYLTLNSAEEALLSLDGRENYRLKPDHRLCVRPSGKTFCLKHIAPYCFFQVLQQKMNWDI